MNWPARDLDEKVWPKKRDFQMLTSWFEMLVSSMVPGLGDDEIEVEEFDVRGRWKKRMFYARRRQVFCSSVIRWFRTRQPSRFTRLE
jgi:hypothetical protein